MSEYQYYEFLAIDRPLTDTEMGELRSISSRGEITPTSFSNEYNWGNLKADPRKLLTRYFDAHVYVTNWGTRRFAMRFPVELVDLDELQSYCVDGYASVERVANFAIVDLWSETEDYEDWVEGSGWMASLAPVRTGILRGDLRALYLSWLLAVQNEELDEAEPEPPLPPGLETLAAPLQRLVQFLCVDEHLVAAAAEQSALEESEPAGLSEWIAALPGEEKDRLLLNVAQGQDAEVGIRLLRRYRAAARNGTSKSAGTRTVRELLERAAGLRENYERERARRAEEEQRRREEAAAAAHAKHLDALAGQEAAAWEEVERLVSSRKPKAYEEALLLLKDLREVSVRDNRPDVFRARFASICQRHAGKPSFIARLERGGLLSGRGSGQVTST